jgi:hypothetical protein
VWAGGLAGVAAYVILGLASHFLGFDIQAAMVAAFGPSAPDLQGMLATVIALAVAHFTSPSLQDIVQHVNNAVVEVASATPGNPTTAVIVPEAQSDAAAKSNAIAGKIPTDTVKQMVTAGMIDPKTAAIVTGTGP